MTDQHRMDAIGAYGNHVILTRHLDSLAAGGARFTNCWTQHPVCMPSRASIFTGRYPSSHGVRTNGIPLPLREKTLAQVLLDQGYATFGTGKFHFIPQFPYRSPLPTMTTMSPFTDSRNSTLERMAGAASTGSGFKRIAHSST
jgi:arylsulfatase A-like enzyme